METTMNKVILALAVALFSLVACMRDANATRRNFVQTTVCFANDTGHRACIVTRDWLRPSVLPRNIRAISRVRRSHSRNHAIVLTARDIAFLLGDGIRSIPATVL